MLNQSRTRSILVGLFLPLFFLVPLLGYADVSCPENGTESPNHPGCCYTGNSSGGACVVSACDDRACPSNEEIYGSFVNQDSPLTSIEGDLMIDQTTGRMTIVSKINSPQEDQGVIDDDLSSFSVSPGNGGGVIDDDLTSFFGTILNPIRNFFVQIATNVREFSSRIDLPHARNGKWSILEKGAYQSDKEKVDGIDEDLSSFNVSPNTDDGVIDDDLSSFRYGNTECDITISAGGITQAQKTEIKACLLDPTLSVSLEEKNALLQMLNK